MIFESVLRECSKTEENIVFVIPVSPSTLRQQRFFNDVQMLFSNNEAARNKMMFTLKEKEYYHHVSRYNDRIQAYRRMGIYIALDRLGVFHTTMLYLKDLDVDIVCFDTLYGRHIKEKGYQAILSGLNTTAKDLSIKTWIKMIEDEEGARIASKIGIDCMQGNYLGRISLLDEVLKKGSR
jgi:EAL domain-containing protein (putative c-di-GMP-specific phosphodiesterase class I)